MAHHLCGRAHSLPISLFTVAVLLVLVFAGASSSIGASASEAALSQPVSTYWPSGAWRTSTPEAQGIDSEQLVRMLEYVQQRQIALHSLLIVRHGYLVTEAYFQPFQADTIHDIQSCEKSVVSALVGIAIDHGYLQGVDQPLLSFFPNRTIANLDERKESITLEDLLTMSAGFTWDEWRPVDPQSTSYQLSASRDQIQFVLDRPMSDDPGTRWNYSAGLPLLLGTILQDVTATDIASFAQQYLFDPLGLDATLHVVDRSTAMSMALNPQDMAKFGYLYQQHGVWDGQQILSPEYVATSVSNHVPTAVGGNYGYFWWLPPYGGYQADGDGGQRITVLPDKDTIVVITAGLTYPDMGTVPDQLIQDFILPAVVSNDPLPDNPAASARLADLVQSLAQPDPQPVAALPEIASTLSGRTFRLQPNSIGLQTIALSFAGDDATLSLSFGGPAQPMAVGLDRVYRVTPLRPSGLIYGWMALRGTWQGSNTFAVQLLMTGVARNLLFQFDDDSVTVWYLGSCGEREQIPGTLTA